MDEDVILTIIPNADADTSVTTTKRQSPFHYDNNDAVSNNDLPSHFPYQNKIAAVIDGTFYDISSDSQFTIEDDYIYVPSNQAVSVYNETSGMWEAGWQHNLPFLEKVSVSDIRAQNLDSHIRKYYTTESFLAGDIPVPMGTVFDSIYTVDALGGVLAVLPVLMAVLVGFVAVRKGIAFIRSYLKRG